MSMYGVGRQCDIDARLNVLVQQRAKIHPVQLIAAQNQIIIERALEEVAHVLPDRVGRALIPLRARRRLLRRKNIDETAREIVELVARLDMSMQRHAVELRQHVNRAQPRVEAIADRDIDDAIFSAEGHRRFRTVLG